MKTTNKSTVEYIQHMGSDDTIVDAARVSFDKHHENYSKEQNEKLIKYLAKHGHWSPLAHTSIQLRVTAPIFVARQLVKHQVGGVWNEVSRRYVDDEPTFYFPTKWRKRAENKKQGSSDETLDVVRYYGNDGKHGSEDPIYAACADAVDAYNYALELGVAPEQARMILPQNMVTSWYWTGSLMFFHRVYKQRTDNHSQLETQEVAHQIGDICAELFPVSWAALTGGE